jgi:hypothetical protein
MSMKKNSITITSTITATGLALGLLTGTASAQTNQVVNGSFEAGPAGEGVFTSWGWLGPAGENSDYGVAQSSVTPDVAEKGSYYAYFRGHPTDGSQDCLGITVHLKLGALYTVSFYLATDGSTTNSGAGMWVVIGPSFGIDLSQDVELAAIFPNSPNVLPYQEYTTNYLATNTSPVLSFHGINGTNTSPATGGLLLDNVSMVLAYPPLNFRSTKTNSLVFTWPFTNSPYRLQSSAILTTNSWTTLTNLPVNVSTNNQIIMPKSANAQFFRLTLP